MYVIVINSVHCEQASEACPQSRTGAMQGKSGNEACVPVTQPTLFYHPGSKRPGSGTRYTLTV